METNIKINNKEIERTPVIMFKTYSKDKKRHIIGIRKIKDETGERRQVYNDIIEESKSIISCNNTLMEEVDVIDDFALNMIVDNSPADINTNEMYLITKYIQEKDKSISGIENIPIIFSEYVDAYKYAQKIEYKGVKRIEKIKNSFLHNLSIVVSINSMKEVKIEKIFPSEIYADNHRRDLIKKDIKLDYEIKGFFDINTTDFHMFSFFNSEVGKKRIIDINSRLLFSIM